MSSDSSKIFVLDTNVLLHDARAIYKFEENTVVIPIYVIEEIDGFKKELSERGRNARELARTLDDLRAANGHSLQEGVPIPSHGEGPNGTLVVAVPKGGQVDLMRHRDNRQMDHAIMNTALEWRDAHPDRPVIFVTMDSNLRIRADVLGLRAEGYEHGRVNVRELYSGIVQVPAPKALVDQLGKRESVEVGELNLPEDLHPNACIVLAEVERPKHTALGRLDQKKGLVEPLRVGREGAWGIRPRNLEQYFALDMLLDPDVHLLTLVGKAGTGKTLLAVAAGLQAVLDERNYARLVVSRPIFPLGRDVGYLPGTLEEKLNPWMQPIFDNLEYIFTARHHPASDYRDYEELLREGMLQIEPLTYIRGRSLPNQFLIVDEAQNLTPHEMKTIVTRAGANTKIVLTGDPEQIDNPYVDSASNGLTILAERFRNEEIAGHVTLVKGERSPLAERATKLL
ncbi:MAG: phosphate starvation-inducible protein PhoH [Sandaracinus sp.]|nr:phosphate starvation-inducible protein PhoH [Sandaracinus sp.]